MRPRCRCASPQAASDQGDFSRLCSGTGRSRAFPRLSDYAGETTACGERLIRHLSAGPAWGSRGFYDGVSPWDWGTVTRCRDAVVFLAV